MKIIMHGALGRMGKSIIRLAHETDGFTIGGAVDAVPEMVGRDIGLLAGIGDIGVPLSARLEECIKEGDVVIDFTFRDTVVATGEICARHATPLVVGTTGLEAGEVAEFKEKTASIPCVYAPNMSVGVNVLLELVAEAARLLGDGYDIEITEAHHRFKKDAPSGTAKHIAGVIADTLGRDLETEAVYGRHGITGERTSREIGIHALRLGDVVGEHTVMFSNLGERIELAHKAHSRDALARGALRAAAFVMEHPPGLYSMRDVLGIG